MHPISSKILLFGEYSVVVGGSALAMPLRDYQGNFRFPSSNAISEAAKWSNQALQQFAQAIKVLTNQQKLSLELDISSFEKDIKQHLYFESNIPKGYGLGSSGAVVAGVVHAYGAYSASQIQTKSLAKLQSEFAILESHFHGKSSGFDPLICYLNRGILKKGDEIHPIELQLKKSGEYLLFLLDTQLSRETSPLVNLFLNRLKREKSFDSFCKTQLKPTNEQCITAFLNNEGKNLFTHFQELSFLQWQEFQDMIPHFLQSAWKAGIESQKYALKLCGAGGGGCMLGMTTVQHWSNVQQTFGTALIKEICRL